MFYFAARLWRRAVTEQLENLEKLVILRGNAGIKYPSFGRPNHFDFRFAEVLTWSGGGGQAGKHAKTHPHLAPPLLLE